MLKLEIWNDMEADKGEEIKTVRLALRKDGKDAFLCAVDNAGKIEIEW